MLSKKLTHKSLVKKAVFVTALTLLAPVTAVAKPTSKKTVQKTSAPEFTISEKNSSNLSLWYRIKAAVQHRLEQTFKTQKKLKDILRNGNVIVKFYRPGCKYCSHIEPIFETVKGKYADEVTFVSVNLNAQSVEYKNIYRFEYVPTIIYFKDGKEVMRHDSNDGKITAQEVEQHVLNLIDTNTRTTRTELAPKVQGTSISKLSSEERACVGLLISLAESHAIELSELMHSFFDTKGNTEPYKVHVSKFYNLLMKIDGAIMAPIKSAIKDAKNPEYKKLLSLVEKLVADLHSNLKQAHKLLDKHIGKKALELAKALGDFKSEVETRTPAIEATVKELFSMLRSLDQELANKVDAMQKTLAESFEMEHNNLVLMNRLNQRMRF